MEGAKQHYQTKNPKPGPKANRCMNYKISVVAQKDGEEIYMREKVENIVDIGNTWLDVGKVSDFFPLHRDSRIIVSISPSPDGGTE